MARKNRSKGARTVKKGKTQASVSQKEAIAVIRNLEELNNAASTMFSVMEKDMTSIFKTAHAKEIGDLHSNFEESRRLLSEQARFFKD